MSKKQQQKKPSIKQSRQNSKLQRIIKFIQNNNPINPKITSSTQPHSPNRTVSKFQNHRQLQPQTIKKQNNIIITQSINLYIDKTSQSNNRHASTLDHVQKRSIKQKTFSQIKNIMSDYSIKQSGLLPIIKVVKTQQTPGYLSKYKQKQLGRLLMGKKYDSLLLIPRQLLVNKQKNQSKFMKQREKSLSNRRQCGDAAKLEYLKMKKISRSGQKQSRYNFDIKDYGFTGWQTSYQLKQFQHINYLNWY